MRILQKTKNLKFPYLNWLISFTSFTGLFFLCLILLIGDGKGSPIENPGAFRFPLIMYGILFIISYTQQYLNSIKNSKAITELTDSVAKVEREEAASLMVDRFENVDIVSVAAIMNHSIQSLNEKNIKLKIEMDRNEHLTENISEFYEQMRILKDADIKFDFFEYVVENESFSFISGMITSVLNNFDDTMISAKQFFNDHCYFIKYEEFINLVKKGVEDDAPVNFECKVKGKLNKI